MTDLNVFSTQRSTGDTGVTPVTARKKGYVQVVIRSGLLTLTSHPVSEQEALFIIPFFFFAASKHNQPLLGTSSKINSPIPLPSTWKEEFPVASAAAA